MTHRPPRRSNVEGRTCCIYCQQMVRDGTDGLKYHARALHPQSLVREKGRRYKLKPSLNGDGRLFCFSRQPKVVYENIEAAWLAAALVFAERGFIVTPYFCWGCTQWHLSRSVLALAA